MPSSAPRSSFDLFPCLTFPGSLFSSILDDLQQSRWALSNVFSGRLRVRNHTIRTYSIFFNHPPTTLRPRPSYQTQTSVTQVSPLSIPLSRSRSSSRPLFPTTPSWRTSRRLARRYDNPSTIPSLRVDGIWTLSPRSGTIWNHRRVNKQEEGRVCNRFLLP